MFAAENGKVHEGFSDGVYAASTFLLWVSEQVLGVTSVPAPGVAPYDIARQTA